MIPNYLTRAPGHSASECKANRVFDMSNVPEMNLEAAWNSLQRADKDRELDDFRTVGITLNPIIPFMLTPPSRPLGYIARR